MDIATISKTDEIMIANTLKELYYVSVVENEHEDASLLLQDIISWVEASLDKQRDAFEQSPGVSFYFPSAHDITKAFLTKYHDCISKAEAFAYSINCKFGYDTDIASVVAPYFLYQAGIANEDISFYIGLGLVIANIICDTLARKKEEKDIEEDEKKIRTICKELKEMLIISKNNANEDEVSVINKSIEVIDKIIDTDE